MTIRVCALSADKAHRPARMTRSRTLGVGLASALRRHALELERVGLETGQLAPWLYHSLKELGLPVVCLDARRARTATALQRNKTDAHDAEATGSLGTFDDAQPPSAAASGRTGSTWPLVSSISEDGEDEGEQRSGAVIQHQCRTVAVLDVGRMHDGGQQQSERVDEDVVLDPLDLLARIEADRVNLCAPFSAALTDLLSKMAAVGLASLPACSRQAT